VAKLDLLAQFRFHPGVPLELSGAALEIAPQQTRSCR
jgi:hypothetical protein